MSKSAVLAKYVYSHKEFVSSLHSTQCANTEKEHNATTIK